MNQVHGAIANLTNAMRVYAAIDIQSAVKGQIIDAGIQVSSNPLRYEMHGITFKRKADNHLIRIYLCVERGESSCEGERYGAPGIRLHCDATHDADQLLTAVISLFGGAVQIRPEGSTSADYPWSDMPGPDQPWVHKIPAGRAMQIKLVDAMPEQGLELLKTFGPAKPDVFLRFRDVLAAEAALSEWDGNADKEFIAYARKAQC